jgi:phosphosulfolactate synthase (CoM biosynthesis protein A)
MPASQDIIARRRKNKEEVKDVVSARMELDQVEEARRALNDNARVAAEALIDGLFSEDDKVRTKSANDVLDRVGVSRVMRNESTNKSTVLIIDSVMAERIISTLDLDCD